MKRLRIVVASVMAVLIFLVPTLVALADGIRGG